MSAIPARFGASGLLATWFGVGLLPWAPGTWGSLAALPCAAALVWAGGHLLLAIACLVVFLTGCWAAAARAAELGADDPGQIVIDEVVGQWLVLLTVPLHWGAYAAGLVLFRLFDILKPWPISWADRRVPGGLGIMLDDVIAGLFGLVLLTFWLWWFA